MSGATAMIATILGICPITRLDNKGKIIAYSKVRGTVAVFFLGDERTPDNTK